MYGGFVTSSLVTTQLSGTTDNINNIGLGSSLIGVNISGYAQSSNEDFPLTWTGQYSGSNTSWLELSEGNQVVNLTNPQIQQTIYTVETDSGSLSVGIDQPLLTAGLEYSGGGTYWNIAFKTVEDISPTADYLVKYHFDTNTWEYCLITNGWIEAGQSTTKELDLEPSDMYLVNGFVVHNFKNGGLPPEGDGCGGGDGDSSFGPQGAKGQKEKQVPLVQVVVVRVHKVQQVKVVLKEQKVVLAHQVVREHKVLKVLKGIKVLQDQQVLREHKVLKVHKVQQEHKVLKVPQVVYLQVVQQVQQVIQVIQVHKVTKVVKVHQVELVTKVVRVQQEHKVQQVHNLHQHQQVQKVKKDKKV